jgi:bifunctional DNA-binding transcriptional regulator/antitoxin component of YhaV-PrlF toxin-antitoxin module
MNTTARIQHKGQVTIPTSVRRQAGRIVITPKPVIDEEYTPAQRRIIDVRLAEADEDIRHGRVQGPFESHKEFIASLHKEARKLGAKKTKRPVR